MSTTSVVGPTLAHRFATELPELALPWQAAEAPDPRLLVLGGSLAAELGLDADWLRSPAGVRLLVGADVPEGASPVAQAYAGHQFGGYSPRLGDGRALLLGELDTPIGTRDLHLKGSGRTPFSRGGDGYAAVGPMLREHVISEAMHALGIPTTRSLAVVATGRPVHRETGVLPGAVLARVASSHLRVGSFQYVAATGDLDLLRRLTDHAIARHHPAAAEADVPALALFEAVVGAQARLLAQWMLVGFVHGVMNTDNMTISGETIDYGPCAFVDVYDPATVFSSIDSAGRYALGNQPPVAEWNLARLAEALLPIVDDSQERAVELVVEALGGFREQYAAAWSTGLRAKLGLPSAVAEAVAQPLGNDLLALLHAGRVDWTTFWRALAAGADDSVRARDLFLDLPAIDAWLERWRALGPDPAVMNRVNPVHIPRNHLVEEALDAATGGDLAPVDRLLDAVRQPFVVQEGLERYAEPGPLDPDYRTFCGT